MTEKERKFKESILKKIKDYEIKKDKNTYVTFNDCLTHAKNQFVNTVYYDKTSELVDIGIEKYLCQKSPYYFISKYCSFTLPGIGELPGSNLYYYQKEILKDFIFHKKVVLTKSRQCLTEDNFVKTNRGYISIKDVKIGDKIETIKDGKVIYTDVLDFIPQGKKKVCQITTLFGDIITSTLDHKFLTKNGWKEAKDLTLNDELISNKELGSFGNFEFDNDLKAALIGYYLADGKADTPVFVNTDLDYINECKEAGELFDVCYPTIRKRKKGTKSHLQGYDLVFTSKSKNSHLKRPFLEFKKRFNLNKLSVDRILTDELMNLNKRQMSIMLNRLFCGDGWCSYRKRRENSKTYTYEVGLGAPNLQLLKQIEYILKTKYGIGCKVQEQKGYAKKGFNRFWKLRIQRRKDVERFIEEIGIYKKDEKIKKAFLEEKEENIHLSHQSDNKIKKIVLLDDEQEVYDITTGTHDFLTNGVVVHNCGLSTLMALIFFWKIVFFGSQWGVIISKDGKSSTDVYEKIKDNFKNIPFWLGVKDVINNQKGCKMNNKSKIDSFARSKSSGRGTSPTILLLDEFAFYQTKGIAEGIVSSVVPSAAKTGAPIFIVSTPNGTTGEGQLYYEQVQELKNCGGYDPMTEAVLYDVQWWMCPDYEGITPYKGYNDKLKYFEDRDYWNNPAVKKEAEEFFRPIAEKPKENPWLAYQFKTSGEVKFRQEILQDFVVMGNSVFSKPTIEKVQEKVRLPIKEGDLGKRNWHCLWYWQLPEKGHRYILGQDVAKGTADDSTSIQVLDIDTGEQVAEYLGRISTKEGARLANDLGRYYNNAYIIVECNSIGEAVFNDLYYNYNYENMYKMKKINKHDKTQVWTGWMTTTKTRELITDCFIDYMADDDFWADFYPHSQRLVDQMKTWVWAGGRPDHTETSHDDDIMAMAILLYNLPKVKQIMPRGEEAKRKTFFIGEDGQEINLENREEIKDIEEENLDKIKNIVGGNNSYFESDEDIVNAYKWLIS